MKVTVWDVSVPLERDRFSLARKRRFEHEAPFVGTKRPVLLSGRPARVVPFGGPAAERGIVEAAFDDEDFFRVVVRLASDSRCVPAGQESRQACVGTGQTGFRRGVSARVVPPAICQGALQSCALTSARSLLCTGDDAERGDAPEILALIDAWLAPALSILGVPASASSITWNVDLFALRPDASIDQWWYFDAHTSFAVDGYTSFNASIWAQSADQTSLGTPGTTETAGALRRPPRAYGEPRRLLSFAPFQSSSGECRLTWPALE